MASITHDELFDDYDSSEEVESEEPARPSEQYMKGGRDTVVLAWGVTGLVIAGFMLCSAAAGPAPAAVTTTVTP
jgi:hypothetical protein